jgi:plasmid stabilization system protein ParE
MKRRIIYDPKAENDLDEQFFYIAQDSLEAAIRFVDAA